MLSLERKPDVRGCPYCHASLRGTPDVCPVCNGLIVLAKVKLTMHYPSKPDHVSYFDIEAPPEED